MMIMIPGNYEAVATAAEFATSLRCLAPCPFKDDGEKGSLWGNQSRRCQWAFGVAY